tara:strand:+ start:1419 stop:1826 length:408 start_codon:yes stop_codon:yes gene_type:complete
MKKILMKLKRLSKIKILTYSLFVLIFFNSVALSATFVEQQTMNITKNLRCLVCQGQTIHESNSDFAESMKLFIKKELDLGRSDDEIYNLLINKYGQWIVFDPGISKNTILMWLIPILLFLLGGAIILKYLLKKIR